MPKTMSEPSNYHVEVYPAQPFFGNGSAALDKTACERIAAAIKRHVDDVGIAHVRFDQHPICSHCGARWSEDSPDYNGGCCDADEAARPEGETS